MCNFIVFKRKYSLNDFENSGITTKECTLGANIWFGFFYLNGKVVIVEELMGEVFFYKMHLFCLKELKIYF